MSESLIVAFLGFLGTLLGAYFANRKSTALIAYRLEQLEEKLQQGDVILDVEPAGAKIVKEKRPDAILIFIVPPSEQELERRLRGRGDTSEEQIAMRLERAKWEMDQRSWYDYVVVNDDVDRCANEILNIIAEKADK